MDSRVMNTYGRFNIRFNRGAGMYLYDESGKKYIDLLAGIAVCSLGHCHPDLVAALETQARSLWHTSNLFPIPPQEALAVKLCELSGLGSVFFCNSGAEANEAALKLVRYFHNTNKTGRGEIITMTNSFHGRTLATITATGQTKYQQGFEPLLPGISFAEYNNPAELLAKVNDRTAAVMLELIQGEGGVRPVSPEFLDALRNLKQKHPQMLIVLDEVQTGVGRTGSWFAFQHFGLAPGPAGLQPDVVTLAKGLGGGFPIGVMMAAEAYKDVLKPGTHASTFGGNYLAAACGLKTLEIIENENLLMNTRIMGDYLRDSLRELFKGKTIREIRGHGLMIGVEGEFTSRDIMSALLPRGLIIGVSGDHILRFVPPLIIQKKHIDEAMSIMKEVI